MLDVIQWLKGANFAIYACHFLASWSGRMWGFSLGVFLISIAPGSLHLSAAYGLTNGASVLLFGTVVGDWVDRTPRLKAALRSMILQNCFVIVTACIVFVFLFLTSNDNELDTQKRYIFYSIITILSVMSRLMKVGRVIVIERDWIVEIAKSRNTSLTVLTSTFRRIDLVSKILAPMISGIILNFAGLKVGCAFISSWCAVSLAIEYFLIRRVYNIVPVLKQQKHDTIYTAVPKPQRDNLAAANTKGNMSVEEDHDATPATTKAWSPMRILASFIIIYKGFRTYFRYDVRFPGMALAALYLTALGFDSVTVGYATTQGLSSSLLGTLVGVGAGFGICATFTYPFIVKRIGLANTGVLALGLQVMCLSLCVISVFLPGSPFDLSYSSKELDVTGMHNCSSTNSTSLRLNLTSTPSLEHAVTTPCSEEVKDGKSMVSIYVMLAGIVSARFGLWTADLTIIQLFLERVKPTERGVVNGFQSSLNQMMDLLKYALVAAIPYSHQFGLLVFISFSFICTGWALMATYAVKTWRQNRSTR